MLFYIYRAQQPSLIDQARDKTDFAHYDEPDNIFVLDIRMLRQAALLLQKMQAMPVIVSTARDREYIDYICPRYRDTITQRRKGQKEGLYRPRYHDSCGQRLCWEKLAIRGKVKIKKQEDSKWTPRLNVSKQRAPSSPSKTTSPKVSLPA